MARHRVIFNSRAAQGQIKDEAQNPLAKKLRQAQSEIREPKWTEMNSAKKWLWIRVMIVALGGLSCADITSSETVAKSDVDWFACAILPVVIPFMLLALVGLQAVNPASAPTWRRPSWWINPFLLREPLQFIHLGAFSFMAGGIVGVATLPFRGMPAAPLAVSLLSIGVGLWLGIQLCMKAYRKKMAAV